MAYRRKGWRFWVPLIFSALGFLIGTAILICFQTAYNNFHAAAWGGASGVLSGLTFVLHLAVRFDYEMKLNPDIFTTLMVVGNFSFMSGFGAVIGYLVKGIMKNESGIFYLCYCIFQHNCNEILGVTLCAISIISLGPLMPKRFFFMIPCLF